MGQIFEAGLLISIRRPLHREFPRIPFEIRFLRFSPGLSPRFSPTARKPRVNKAAVHAIKPIFLHARDASPRPILVSASRSKSQLSKVLIPYERIPNLIAPIQS